MDRHDGGLVRFDGIKFKNFLTPEYASKLMFGGVITHLLEHSSGEIWVAADNGVYIFNPFMSQCVSLKVKLTE